MSIDPSQIPPTAEPGTSTTEWKVTIGAFASNTIALAVAFGVHLDAAQQAAILAWVATTTALAGLFGLSRGIRKKGTTG